MGSGVAVDRKGPIDVRHRPGANASSGDSEVAMHAHFCHDVSYVAKLEDAVQAVVR
jgi:hypothetical protein